MCINQNAKKKHNSIKAQDKIYLYNPEIRKYLKDFMCKKQQKIFFKMDI